MPAAKREAVTKLKQTTSISERRACRLIGISRSSYKYQRVARTEDPVRHRLKELSSNWKYRRYGTPRLTALLKSEGYTVNHKRIERLYREEGLAYKRRKTKKQRWGTSQPLCELTAPNQEWAMDFISDSLSTGQKCRILNILDQYTRESLAMEIDTSLPGERVTRVLNRICEERGLPDRIRMDNGPEFTSKVMKNWFREKGVTPIFIEPGKPNQNGYVESFHGKFRDECLNLFWFRNLQEIREAAEEWRTHYNNYRHHSSLGNRTPREFAALHVEVSPPTAPSLRHEETALELSTVVLS